MSGSVLSSGKRFKSRMTRKKTRKRRTGGASYKPKRGKTRRKKRSRKKRSRRVTTKAGAQKIETGPSEGVPPSRPSEGVPHKGARVVHAAPMVPQKRWICNDDRTECIRKEKGDGGYPTKKECIKQTSCGI